MYESPVSDRLFFLSITHSLYSLNWIYEVHHSHEIVVISFPILWELTVLYCPVEHNVMRNVFLFILGLASLLPGFTVEFLEHSVSIRSSIFGPRPCLRTELGLLSAAPSPTHTSLLQQWIQTYWHESRSCPRWSCSVTLLLELWIKTPSTLKGREICVCLSLPGCVSPVYSTSSLFSSWETHLAAHCQCVLEGGRSVRVATDKPS